MLEVKYSYDPTTYRHFINDKPFVLHCHHYMSLTTRLAQENLDLGGPRILRESAVIDRNDPHKSVGKRRSRSVEA